MKAGNCPKSNNKTSEPGQNDVVLSFLNDNYKVSYVVALTGERALTFPAILMLIYHSFSVSFTGYHVEPL